MGAALSLEGVPNVVLGPRGGRRLHTAARMASVGIELSVSTVVGLLGGRWLDGKLGTDPYLMIVGLLLGVTAGFKSLVQTARRAERQASSQEKRDD